jgi:hypothetical protein
MYNDMLLTYNPTMDMPHREMPPCSMLPQSMPQVVLVHTTLLIDQFGQSATV